MHALRSQIETDCRYLGRLLFGLLQLLVLQISLGLCIYAICISLPKANHRSLRFSLGFPVISIAIAVAFRIFDPADIVLGAVGVATLIAFNSPLRCIQLLATPPVAVTPKAAHVQISTLRFVVALVTIPAAAVWDDYFICAPRKVSSDMSSVKDVAAEKSAAANLESLKISQRDDQSNFNREVAGPVSINVAKRTHPGSSVAAASAAFALVSAACHIVPSQYVLTKAFLVILISVATSGFATFSTSIFGFVTAIPIVDAFSYPWFAPSLSSFWAYRWNAPIASALRSGVFQPLYAYCGLPKIACAMLSFCASGVAHVVILYFANINKGWIHWMCFFLVHGIAVCLERAAINAGSLSPLHRRIIAICFTVYTVSTLFVDPFMHDGTFEPFIHELATGFRLLSSIFRLYIAVPKSSL